MVNDWLNLYIIISDYRIRQRCNKTQVTNPSLNNFLPSIFSNCHFLFCFYLRLSWFESGMGL